MEAEQQLSSPAMLSSSPQSGFGFSRSKLPLIAAGSALALLLGATVHAADDAGVYDFIRSQDRQSRAAPSSVPAPLVRTFAPGPVASVPRPFREAARPRVRVHAVERPREPVRAAAHSSRVRFAALPQEDERPKVTRKARSAPTAVILPTKVQPLSKPKEAGSDPAEALLRDPTLRPGDIVVFPDGPRVFRGDRALPHRAEAFVALEHSRLVSKAARKAVLAMTGRVVDPASEARRYVPSGPLSADPSVPQRQAQSEAVRVVYPTTIR